MSDYISKSEVMTILTDVELKEGTFTEAKSKIRDIPTVDETEIIRKAFERVVERLEKHRKSHKTLEDYELFNGTYHAVKQHEMVVEAYEKAIKIVKEECEINE